MPDCRAATSKPFYHPLHDNHTATIMPMPRHQIPILIVARFLSRLPRYTRGIRLLGISMSSLAAEQAEQPEFSLPV